jgi:hydrogenase maturation protein HypF
MTDGTKPAARVRRLRLAVRGAVQGVGFRPFVFQLAQELGLRGWVNNSPQGVLVEVESLRPALEKFMHRLETEKPPHSSIESLEAAWLDSVGFKNFEIRPSESNGSKSALVPPDVATCPDCLREIFNLHNRRFRYPFTNCTHCGPRFSIIESLPYDRANTTMRGFTMCRACREEYEDPADRRFHAQPNACPECGPRLEFWNAEGEVLFGSDEALLAAAQTIRDGKIVAVKGIGGFHLLADARNENAIQRLRTRKDREEKPFALLFPSLISVKTACEVSRLEERLLLSPGAPIVLLKKIGNRKSEIGNSVAPGNPDLGVMLAANPLQHLLLADLNFPVVATSGNVSDEPICTDEYEALRRLRGLADWFLVHDRPIVRHEDDSIVRVMLGREMILRRARGYAPLPVQIKNSKLKIQNVLAVGGHLKNSIALAVGENVFLSQHIGDLETEPANRAFRRVCQDLPGLYAVTPEIIAADLHPDYLSTKFAGEMARTNLPPGQHAQPCVPAHVGVQHHVAHVLSCIADNELKLPALGAAWDGTGYGTDGTVWGGEFFHVTQDQVRRVAQFRSFRLPGGNRAVREPRRVALGLLYELYGEAAFEMGHLPPLREMPAVERITLKGMLQRQFNSPPTSSVGRLFDVVASLVNLRQQMCFEGQAAMELEFAIGDVRTDEGYHLPFVPGHPTSTLDWSLMIHAILVDVNGEVPVAQISAKFHNALAEAAVAVAQKIGEPRVVLSGGCFQNRYLTERTVKRLREAGFQPHWHRRVPPNDGGIALGQIYAARNSLTLK